jgi:predicted enzyme related to lactoylglutathione lyase
MPEPRDPVAHFALQVPTDQIAPLSAAVMAGGGQVTSEPQVSERFGITVTTAFCRDTEGNAFELTDAA